MSKIKIAVVFGTRPEAIKMAPVIKELEKHSTVFDLKVIVTAQHREMLDQVLNVFFIKPDYDLNIMKKNQTLSDITSDALIGVEKVFEEDRPDFVLVHGDTTTSLAAALAAFYQKIPVGHVEAGLRTHDMHFPFPEEANRKLIDALSDLHFVPTHQSKLNLLNEGINPDKIIVTGNTAIDAVLLTKSIKTDNNVIKLMDSSPEQIWILLTMHRRENYGDAMKNVFEAVNEIVKSSSNISIIVPVHLSPAVQEMARLILGNNSRIHLIKPLEVDVFHRVISRSYLVLTDSGGLQEEAPALNVPVLVLRNKTERPEGLEAGTLKVVGTEKNSIKDSIHELINNRELYQEMADAINPYGDGFASKRIIQSIKDFFKVNYRED